MLVVVCPRQCRTVADLKKANFQVLEEDKHRSIYASK